MPGGDSHVQGPSEAVARDCPGETTGLLSAPPTSPGLGQAFLLREGDACWVALSGTGRAVSPVTPPWAKPQHPLLPPKGHRKYTSAQSPREGAQALLRKSFQAPKVTPSQLQAPKEAASILRPRFTCLCNGNIHTTLPGALCLLPREEGALDFPQASGTVCDFMDTASQDAQTALGVAWLLGPGLAYWPWREGCSGNSGIIFINTKHVPWGGVDFCSMAGSKTMFLYLITSY